MLGGIGAICLLWFLAGNPSSIVAQKRKTTTSSPVVDTNGKPVEAGVQYYILESGGGHGLNIILSNNTCPYFVGYGDEAAPVVMTPFSEEEKIIHEGRDVRIRFDFTTNCDEKPAEWRIYYHPARLTLLAAHGGNVTTYLKIGKDGNGYSLAFCPLDECPRCGAACHCEAMCGNVGAYYGPGFPGREILELYANKRLKAPMVFKRVSTKMEREELLKESIDNSGC